MAATSCFHLNNNYNMEESVVRINLMNDENYNPYCGNWNCKYNSPRAKWSKEKSQFTCGCGWVSEFPADFINRYKAKWASK